MSVGHFRCLPNAPNSSLWYYFLSHPSWLAVAILLIAPPLEELGFRAFLSSAPKFVFVGLPLFAMYAYWFVEPFLPRFFTPTSSWVALTFLYQFWPILPAGAISLLLYRYRREATLASFHQPAAWIFWASCILFGAGHYPLYSDHVAWWGFVLVIPQFLVGIGLAYLRVRFGLRWSIATHYAVDILFALWAWPHYWAASSLLEFSAASTHAGALAGVFAYDARHA